MRLAVDESTPACVANQKYLELITPLTALSGLLHDIGKAIAYFQSKLRSQGLREPSLIRHEWVSLRLFQAFVGSDTDEQWLTRLSTPTADDHQRWLGEHLQRDGLMLDANSVLKAMQHAPLAQAVGWLVVTHHRMLTPPHAPTGISEFQETWLDDLFSHIGPRWNEPNFCNATKTALRAYWEFPDGLSVTTPAWQAEAANLAKRLLPFCQQAMPAIIGNPYVMHVSRLCLMFADHYYSRLGDADHPDRAKVTAGNDLWANIKSGGGCLQPLDEHLIGVARHGAELAAFMPHLKDALPRLVNKKQFKAPTQLAQFAWQNKAVNLAARTRRVALRHGAFVINMASTGCGKTLGNAKIMNALADPKKGFRCAFAMGLRTLTLQTGKMYTKLGLDDTELATLIGSTPSKEMFNYYADQAEVCGSASAQNLLSETSYVSYQGATAKHPLLQRLMSDEKVKRLLSAPIIACTIDQLMPATESQRGGWQIAPMLCLMSGDLVLDEPDDFDTSDFPAITRLVHWAGMLGARVLLSSATLPPAFVQGLFEAYRSGRHCFEQNQDSSSELSAIPCIWVDEFKQVASACQDKLEFVAAHKQFAKQRHDQLDIAAANPRRRAELLDLPYLSPSMATASQKLAVAIMNHAQKLHHRYHTVDPQTQKQVSFGLVRFANIAPLYETALAMFALGAPSNLQVHLCVYHSQHPLLIRSALENQLDQALDRKDPLAVFNLPDIRQRLDDSTAQHHLFIVVGSPVVEVGRDHDYDWGILDPSSMRSIIQAGGRIGRHRTIDVQTPNIAIFSENISHFIYPNGPAYRHPGFEEAAPSPFQLTSHNLHRILYNYEYHVVDARPRLLARTLPLATPQQNLTDLEHHKIQAMMLARSIQTQSGGGTRQVTTTRPDLNAAACWSLAPIKVLTTHILQARQRFREDPHDTKYVDVAMLPAEGSPTATLHRLRPKPIGSRKANVYESIEALHIKIQDRLVKGRNIQAWGITSYDDALHKLATALNMTPRACAEIFGQAQLRENADGWRYHVIMGFAKPNQ